MDNKIVLCFIILSVFFQKALSEVPVWTSTESRVQCQTALSTELAMLYSPQINYTSVEWRHMTESGSELVLSSNGTHTVYGPRYNGTDRAALSSSPGSVSLSLNMVMIEDDGVYNVTTIFDDGTFLEADVNLRVFTVNELNSELDNIQVELNGEVLPPGEEMELSPGDTTIHVQFLGGLAPDLLSDVIITISPDNGEPYTVMCEQTRICTVDVTMAEDEECSVSFYLGFQPSSYVFFPNYTWDTFYDELLTAYQLTILVWCAAGLGCLLLLVVIITVPIVVVKKKKRRNKTNKAGHSDDEAPGYTDGPVSMVTAAAVIHGSYDQHKLPQTNDGFLDNNGGLPSYDNIIKL